MGSLQSFKLLYISIFLLFFLSPVLSSYSPQLEILYWHLDQAEPLVLAHVSYDTATLKSDLIDYSPPPTELSQGIARVGFYAATSTNSRQWVGTLVSPSALTGLVASQKPILRLHVSPSNEIYHVSLDSTSVSTSSLHSILVELVADELGPSPHLNRPIVVGRDGKNSEEQPEKTMFQKYWWVFLIVTFLAMSGGGERQ
ncbi:uncharacterized protein DSM5745_08965 [Aspergillus mulundensis]|uniref:ER membrane protein complex subunit 10 n=1 Tax=Aspergillus mulundensis TaxID=1810919 RepID=A0A3D8QZ91_9EURO|nr:Uncharacterized protein DSM5745_08965 [Aspergillus mulundensis]RDW67099.1 Uncharacterized protein DSM5745_08965 [Aspergillus mulundensis]